MSKTTRITRAEDFFWPTPDHPVETIANLDAVPIEENGEPMVALADACPDLLLRPMGMFGQPGRQQLWTRALVAERLNAAQAHIAALRPGWRLVVVDGWRSSARQVRMHRAARFFFRCRYPTLPASLIREAANKYVAAPDALAPPPHSTGGAIDVRLQDEQGNTVPMSGQARTDHEDVLEPMRANRVVLCDAMNHVGFSNYEEEWWHWSYGDSGWALRTNRPTALYGRTSLPSITPSF